MVKDQFKHQASIFSCDEFAVLSDCQHALLIGEGPLGTVYTLIIPAITEATGKWGVNGGTTDSWLNTLTFMQAWQKLKVDGRVYHHDWTVKTDPDAVFFPDRLRGHVRAHTATGDENLLFLNCDRFSEGPALFGSMEVFSKNALITYFDGAEKCKSEMDWHGWGEDYYMHHCLVKLGVGIVFDGDMLSDKRCYASACSDASKVVFHDYKTIASWFECWGQAVSSVN